MSSQSSRLKQQVSNKLKKVHKKNNVISTLQRFFSLFKRKKTSDESIHEFEKTIQNIKAASNYMSNEEKLIFNNFLMFGSKTVAKVMIPRSDICGLSITSTKDELYKIVLKNGHTRTLVYNETLDNIVGFVHIKDLYGVIVGEKEFNFQKLIRKHILAAPSMKLVDLLAEMQKQKTHIAVVIDEYGGTDGIVTIEDILEGIVGKIEDEHDAEVNILDNYKIINPKTIICNARVSVEEIEKALNIQLKKEVDDFETIGGLVLARAGYFPKSGTKLLIDDNIFAEIIESSAKNIKTIKIMIK